jgi:hypothetical protein
MSAISGSTGNVTFANGFAVSPYQWEVRPSGLIVETTPFSPTADYVTRAGANLKGWKGNYKCRQPVTATAAISGPAYLANPFEYTLKLLCKELETTAFGATWRSYVAGLKDAEGSYKVYVDSAVALPLPLTTATALFTVDTGLTYSIPIIIGDEITVGVAVDGSTRIATVPWKATGAPTITGGAEPGATGAATLQAYSGKTYAGTILVTAVNLTVNRDNSNSEWSLDFVGNGALTPA